tara:strand:+ start:1520 stop:2404 length:885 start_codon:yes stop_codon:yes gene_type:complete
MNPKYPVYIISKNRYEVRLTSDSLEKMGVPHYLVVEEQEYASYKQALETNGIRLATLLILDKQYQEDYDPCTDEEWKSNGPGAARNFCWDHSINLGAESHWVMDDNIKAFGRMNKNKYIEVDSGTIFRAAEDFVDRYSNVAISGLQYHMFRFSSSKRPAFVKNTRIYSCLLIRNDIPYRWRGRYNEDTDLSLRVLKDGWCTIQFQAFIQNKATTQTIKGGNTEEFYAYEGTMNKSKMLAEMHPDVAKVQWRFNRWHHFVDYTPFKKTKLILKDGINLDNLTNQYKFKKVKKANA